MPYDPAQDLNGDGKLDIADAVLLLRYVTEDHFQQSEKPVKLRLQAADLDHDGQLTLLDVMCMLSAIRRAGADVS